MSAPLPSTPVAPIPVATTTVTGPIETPPSTRAFGLPDGSVRAAIALLVIGVDLAMNCFYKWAPPNLDTMTAVAFTFYFVGAAQKVGGK